MELKKEKLSYWTAPMFSKSINWEQLIDMVCEHFKITKEQLTCKSRKKEYVEARRIISYIIYTRNQPIAYRDIGILLGGRGHATIMSLCRKAQGFIETEKGYKELVKSFY